jgi:hypothetical protein
MSLLIRLRNWGINTFNCFVYRTTRLYPWNMQCSSLNEDELYTKFEKWFGTCGAKWNVGYHTKKLPIIVNRVQAFDDACAAINPVYFPWTLTIFTDRSKPTSSLYGSVFDWWALHCLESRFSEVESLSNSISVLPAKNASERERFMLMVPFDCTIRLAYAVWMVESLEWLSIDCNVVPLPMSCAIYCFSSPNQNCIEPGRMYLWYEGFPHRFRRQLTASTRYEFECRHKNHLEEFGGVNASTVIIEWLHSREILNWNHRAHRKVIAFDDDSARKLCFRFIIWLKSNNVPVAFVFSPRITLPSTINLQYSTSL